MSLALSVALLLSAPQTSPAAASTEIVLDLAVLEPGREHKIGEP